MSDPVRIKVHVDPREILTDDLSNEYQKQASEVGTRLGGSTEIDLTDYSGTGTVNGYANGSPHYLEATDDAAVQLTTEATAKVVFVQNTGKKYSSVTALGDAYDRAIEVKKGGNRVSLLQPDGAITLVDNSAGIDASAITVQTVGTGGAVGTNDHLAVRFFVGD